MVHHIYTKLTKSSMFNGKFEKYHIHGVTKVSRMTSINTRGTGNAQYYLQPDNFLLVLKKDHSFYSFETPTLGDCSKETACLLFFSFLHKRNGKMIMFLLTMRATNKKH